MKSSNILTCALSPQWLSRCGLGEKNKFQLVTRHQTYLLAVSSCSVSITVTLSGGVSHLHHITGRSSRSHSKTERAGRMRPALMAIEAVCIPCDDQTTSAADPSYRQAVPITFMSRGTFPRWTCIRTYRNGLSSTGLKPDGTSSQQTSCSRTSRQTDSLSLEKRWPIIILQRS